MKTTKLNEYSQRIQELEVKVEHKNNLNNLLKQENDRLRLSNGKLGNEILELKSKCLGMSDAAKELQSQIFQKTQQISAYERSTSWKMTAPYRFISNRIQGILRKIILLSKLIKYGGGVKSSMGYALKIIQREGVLGLLQRIKAADSTNPKGGMFGNDYSEWLDRYAMLDRVESEDVNAHLKRSKNTPLISIVMPVYNPNLVWLDEAIQSVRDQLYPHWQLCIADDKSTDPRVREVLLNYQALDERIKVTFRAANGHISAASNSALELATGEWTALMDQDDLLTPEALYYVFEAIECNPDAVLIYSDEDKIDEVGKRFSPYFKSDWNPDLFLSHNMISHLGVYKSDLVKSLGGFREGREGSQDYDLALRCIEVLKADQILHIPRVLYHWRSHADSTAQSGSNKGYALRVGQQVLNEHFQRMEIKATSELLDFGMYRTRYDLPDALPLVSLIIPTRNRLNLLRQCIDSIVAKTEYANYEIIIVDNNSDDEDTLKYLDTISREKRIRVMRDTRPFNYSALNNGAVQEAKGEFIGLINNDIEVISANWLSEMVSIASQPGVGAVGARLWYPDDTLQHAGVILGLLGAAGHAHKGLPRGAPGYFGRAQLTQTLSAVTAACLIVRKDIFTQVGGLDEENLKVAFNDIDFCIRVREAGYRNVWTPFAELYHHESASRGIEDTPEKQARFLGEVNFLKERWGRVLREDPAYSPNLTLDRDDFSLSWPPRIKTRNTLQE
ncbi:glycosyltransferase family 2 protein [uncultured Phyllobacterium sp.]|uniref:glycosyltransferase family 2 protein n=1 Tax=uncultured Phyllobacterium sp. TaxID=253813 RepID=UPI00258F462B|nr:glycosyltransferase family 2 protein [uncultured Phyllobacterium sp.]